MALITGVDVASYQADTYDISGCTFAIVKCSESTTYVNPRYAAQLAHARSNGLLAGHYHYARGTDSDAEVAYFAKHSDVRAGEIIAMDWEQSEVTPAARDEFLRRMKATFPHHRVILYCNVDYWTTRDTERYAADGLWVADYSASPGHPRISQPWVFHQYSSAGGEDHSVGNFTSKAALVAWSLALVPSKPVPPSEDSMQYQPNLGQIEPTKDHSGEYAYGIPAGATHIDFVADGYNMAPAKLRVVTWNSNAPVVHELWVGGTYSTKHNSVALTAVNGVPVNAVTVKREDDSAFPVGVYLY